MFQVYTKKSLLQFFSLNLKRGSFINYIMKFLLVIQLTLTFVYKIELRLYIVFQSIWSLLQNFNFLINGLETFLLILLYHSTKNNQQYKICKNKLKLSHIKCLYLENCLLFHYFKVYNFFLNISFKFFTSLLKTNKFFNNQYK